MAMRRTFLAPTHLLASGSTAPSLVLLVLLANLTSTAPTPEASSLAALASSHQYGQSDCPSKSTIIGRLVMWNILGLLSVLLFRHRRVSRRLWCSKIPIEDPRHTIEWGMAGMYVSLAWKIGFTYLTAVISRPADAQVWDYFQLWAIRPRATPLIMIAGYMRGYTGPALSAMVVDSILCLIAVQFQGAAMIMEGKFEEDAGSWPPYRIGAVMSVVPLILLVILGLGLLVLFCGCGVCVALASLCICCGKLCGGEKDGSDNSVTWETKDFGWYTGYVLLFLVMWIGRWMMWSNFPPELYCPTMSARVALIWGLGPFAEQLLVSLANTLFSSG